MVKRWATAATISLVVFGLCGVCRAAGLPGRRSGALPEPRAFKPPAGWDTGVAYDHIIRLRFMVTAPSRMPPTATWPTKASFRRVEIPRDAKRYRKVKLSFLPLPKKGLASKIAFRIAGSRFNCDLNGDGKFSGPNELPTERSADGTTGPIVVSAAWPGDDNGRGRYAFYVWKYFTGGKIRTSRNERPTKTNKYAGFAFSRGCLMTGRGVGGTITLIDDDTNGRYDDWGRDALVFNGTAQPLSPVILLPTTGGEKTAAEPWCLRVSQSGRIVILGRRPGSTGILASASPAPPVGGRWRFLVVASKYGFFELSRFEKRAVSLPPGKYRLYAACFSYRGRLFLPPPAGVSFTVSAGEKTAWPDWRPSVPQPQNR